MEALVGVGIALCVAGFIGLLVYCFITENSPISNITHWKEIKRIIDQIENSTLADVTFIEYQVEDHSGILAITFKVVDIGDTRIIFYHRRPDGKLYSVGIERTIYYTSIEGTSDGTGEVYSREKKVCSYKKLVDHDSLVAKMMAKKVHLSLHPLFHEHYELHHKL